MAQGGLARLSAFFSLVRSVEVGFEVVDDGELVLDGFDDGSLFSHRRKRKHEVIDC